jgi:hypothetical protein
MVYSGIPIIGKPRVYRAQLNICPSMQPDTIMFKFE